MHMLRELTQKLMEKDLTQKVTRHMLKVRTLMLKVQILLHLDLLLMLKVIKHMLKVRNLMLKVEKLQHLAFAHMLKEEIQ